MKVWELRDGLARFDGDDPILVRIHAAPGGFRRREQADADAIARVDVEWIEAEPGRRALEAADSEPARVRHAVIEAWIREEG